MNECIRTAEQALATEDIVAAGAGILIFAFWLVFVVCFFLGIFAAAISLYVVSTIPIHKMAKRAGIPNAWLAWVPIGHMYVRLKLSRREFNIFNWIKTRNRDKAFEGYVWMMGGIILFSLLIFVMMFIPLINLLAIVLYYVVMFAFPIALGVFMWRVNYDILMTYGLKEHAMWVSVLYYWCPYFMIFMTYKVMNSEPDYSI